MIPKTKVELRDIYGNVFAKTEINNTFSLKKSEQSIFDLKSRTPRTFLFFGVC